MAHSILTAEQRQFLELLSHNEPLRDQFYLSGGTALAEFYLHHRFSEDLDFFSPDEDIPESAVEKFVSQVADKINVKKVEYRQLKERRLFFLIMPHSELKVEFTYFPYAQLEPAGNHHGIALDSLDDIAANKLKALIGRTESKDFVDVHSLIDSGKYTLNRLRELTQKKFNLAFDPITLGSEFAKVRELQIMPQMLEPLSLDELSKFFGNLALELEKEVIE